MRPLLVMFARAAALAGCVALPASPAAAAPQARAAALQGVYDCKRLTDPQLRLACYDRAAGALDSAEEKGDVVVIDRAQARQVRRQAFGLTMPSIKLFTRGEKEEEVNRLQTTLTGVRRSADGNWVLTTTEEQTWRQTDGQEIFNPPHTGSTLLVNRGAIGSYFCKTDNQFAFRCARDR